MRQRDLAARLGIPVRVLSELENGHREWTERLLRHTAGVLHVPFETLAKDPPE